MSGEFWLGVWCGAAAVALVALSIAAYRANQRVQHYLRDPSYEPIWRAIWQIKENP